MSATDALRARPSTPLNGSPSISRGYCRSWWGVVSAVAASLALLSGCTLRGPDIAADTQSLPDLPASSGASSLTPDSDHPESLAPSPSAVQKPKMPSAPTSFSPILDNEAWTREAKDVSFESLALPTSFVFHDIRVGEHPDFYRVVVDFKELDGTPLTAEQSPQDRQPWVIYARWTQAPVGQGSGLPLDVAGQTFLDLNISKTSMPASPEVSALYYSGPDRLSLGPLEVDVDHTFESNTHIVIGMDTERDIQMGYLLDPTRLVVDVRK